MPDRADSGDQTTRQFLDIEEIAAELRERVTSRTQPRVPPAERRPSYQRPISLEAAGTTDEPLHLSLTASRELWRRILTGSGLIGSSPPVPPTLRGRVGKTLVEVVRRSLFWLTPQIQSFQRDTALMAKEQTSALDEMARRFSRLSGETRRAGEANSIADARISNVESEISAARVEQGIGLDQIAGLQADFAGVLDNLNAVTARIEVVAAGLARVDGVASRMEAVTSDLARLGLENDAAGFGISQVPPIGSAVAGLASALARLRASTERNSLEMQAEIAARERVALSADAVADGIGKLAVSVAALEQLASRVPALEEYGKSTRAELLLMQKRTAVPSGGEGDATGAAAGVESRAALSYLDFQTAFRGTFEDIKNRFSIYLDRLSPGESGSAGAPFVDLGCGRGEWLTLLRERHLIAYGVDSNPAMVRLCTQAGLIAQHDDLLAHMRSLPDESRGGITAFHVAEHLPPPVLDQMLDEFLRVLIPGGIVILETPNPANVFVGTRTFHLDPTHQKPIPSDLLRFMVEERGFAGVEVLPLHPYPKEAMLNVPGDRAAEFIDAHFFGPQDYAVICKKPARVPQVHQP